MAQDFSFYLKSITMENYRKYDKQTFTLDSDMNVFVGKNASGKTSALEAVCVMLGAYLAAYKRYVPSRYVYNISQSDVRIKFREKAEKGIMLSSGELQFPCRISGELQFGKANHAVTYKRILEKIGSRTKFDGSNPMQRQVVDWEEKNAAECDRDVVLPLVLYLSSSRLWDERKSNSKCEIPSRFEGYARCLDPRRGMQLCTDYQKALTLIAAQENAGKMYPSQMWINEAINRAFVKELPEGDTIEYSVRYEEYVQRKPDGSWIPFSELSDGYRNVIRIVGEIATRICILNPYLREGAFSNTPGIVVIDELDLSLHPTWQGRIIDILKSLFPRIQFICATHSPFIIQSLDERELISLDQTINTEYSGRGIEDIAEEVMGVDMPNYSEERKELYRLSAEYFDAVRKAETKEELTPIRQKLQMLTAKYSADPATYALLQQEYLSKQLELEKEKK